MILKTDRLCALIVTGLERLDPGAEYVLASNHQSIYDIPILFASLPLQPRIVAQGSLGGFRSWDGICSAWDLS